MRLTVIGCSGSYPGPDSAASCYVVQAEGSDRAWRILLDLGSGALGPLHRHVDPLAVDAVFLSHLHADHCLDLCGFYVLRTYHPTGPQPRIPVWGPEGVAGRIAQAYGKAEDPGLGVAFDFREYAGPVAVGPFVVEPVEVLHPVPAYALRVTAGGRTLAYSGDTAPCPGLDRAAAGANLLLAEASFRESGVNPPGVHLTGKEAAEAATRAGAAKLVLTHIPPWHDPREALAEAKPAFAGPVDLAAPGAAYDV